MFMDYVHYIIFGPWQGVVSLVLILIGIFFCFVPYLVHPELAFASYAKRGMRSMFGIVFIVAGLIGLAVVCYLGTQKISGNQYQVLQSETKNVPAAQKLVSKHMKANTGITRMDYFLLERKLEKSKQTAAEKQMQQG